MSSGPLATPDSPGEASGPFCRWQPCSGLARWALSRPSSCWSPASPAASRFPSIVPFAWGSGVLTSRARPLALCPAGNLQSADSVRGECDPLASRAPPLAWPGIQGLCQASWCSSQVVPGGLLWEPRPPLLLPPQPGRRRPCEGEPPAQASPSFPRLRLLSHSLGGHRAGGVEGHPGRLPQSPPWMCRPYLQVCVLSSLPWGAPLSAWRRKGGRTQEAAPPPQNPSWAPFSLGEALAPGGILHSTQLNVLDVQN